ncbi:hypothetical protein TeGR_g2148 [Tetraparma gracilis]|jgi:hypothetical protein|uniref:Tubby C-terminal domain-containing protein n=1 Tax=Tetraparma gracilis TaxID=2962635 RepID=A0ABQ6MYT0_9STRA|nr:hypothetical protein TeGR_g2148 [Tetraparma gracilis]
MPSHSPLADATTRRGNGQRNYKAMPTKIPTASLATRHRLDSDEPEQEVSREQDSDDSWANDDDEEEGRNADDDDESDGRNASIFSEREDGDESYPGNEEYGLSSEEKEEEEEEEEEKEEEKEEESVAPALDAYMKRATSKSGGSGRRKEAEKENEKKKGEVPESPSDLSVFQQLQNSSAFHGVNVLTSAPPKLAASSSSNYHMVKCVVIRDKKSTLKSFFPRYTMYFQDGTDKIAMTAEKQTGSRTANYHIWDMTRGSPGMKLSKKSGNYMGKLRGDQQGAA